MKKLFTKEELLKGRGCYSTERINKLFPTQQEISIKEILSGESVNIRDKRWFVCNSCGLTFDEKKELGLIMAWIVLPIYEEKYPNDLRVRECLEGIEKFNKSLNTKDELIILRRDATDAAYAATDAATDAAAAAYATAAAATDAAYAAYAATATAADAAYAAYAADAAGNTYSERIKLALIKFFE